MSPLQKIYIYINIPSIYKNKPVTRIKNDAFYKNSSIQILIIPNSVTTIGDSAFSGCSGLTNVTIPDSVTSIGNEAFSDCSSLTSITIPDSITSIGNSAFYNCYKLVDVYNLSSLNIVAGSSNYGYVGYYAKNIYTSNSETSKITTTKDEYQFYNDNGKYYLISYIGKEKEITLPTNFKGNNYEIYDYAFFTNTNITNITIPDCVTSIGNGAFAECDNLTSVIIGNGVTHIGGYIFQYDSIPEIYYHGTIEEWDNITIENNNDDLLSALRYYYSETQPTDNGNYCRYVNGVPTVW